MAWLVASSGCQRSDDGSPTETPPPADEKAEPEPEPTKPAPDRTTPKPSGIVGKIPKVARYRPRKREIYAGYTVELPSVAWESRTNYLGHGFLVLAVQAQVKVTKDLGKPHDLLLKVTCDIDGAAHAFIDPFSPLDGPSLKRREGLVEGDLIDAKAEAFRLRSGTAPERCQLAILAQRSDESPVKRLDGTWCWTAEGMKPEACPDLVQPPADDEPRWKLTEVVADPSHSYFDLRVNEPLSVHDRIALRTTCPDRKGIRTPDWDSRFWGWRYLQPGETRRVPFHPDPDLGRPCDVQLIKHQRTKDEKVIDPIIIHTLCIDGAKVDQGRCDVELPELDPGAAPLAIHDVSVSPRRGPAYGGPGVSVEMRLEAFRDLDDTYQLSASIRCEVPAGEETKELTLLSMGYLPLQHLHAGESTVIATSGVAGELAADPKRCKAEIRARGVSDTVSLDWTLGTFCAKRPGKTKPCK